MGEHLAVNSTDLNRDRHEAAHCSKRFDDEKGMPSFSNNNSTEDGDEADDHDDDEEEGEGGEETDIGETGSSPGFAKG